MKTVTAASGVLPLAIVGVVLTTLFFLFIPTVFGEESTAESIAASLPGKQLVLLAQVEIYETLLERIDATTYRVSFSLTSNDPIVQKAYYKVVLVDEEGRTIFVHAYATALDLAPNEEKSVTETLTIPSGLEGSFDVLVFVSNENGLPLATGPAGKIILVGTGESTAQILRCTTNEEVYTTTARVEVSCDIEGEVDSNMRAVGTLFKSGGASAIESVTAEMADDKVTFTLSPLSQSGNYEVVTQLVESGVPTGASLSKYVSVIGKTGEILNVNIDKSSYEKGETAKVTGALNTLGFERGEVFAVATLKTAEGIVCAGPVREALTAQNSIMLNLPVEESCATPTIEMTLEDKEGSVLDTKTSGVPSGAIEESPAPTNAPTSNVPLVVVVGVCALLVMTAVMLRRLLSGKAPANTEKHE